MLLVRRVTSQFIRFSIVGVAGFIADTAILYLIVYLLGQDPYVSRVISYLGAATTTWILNRKYTFESVVSSLPHREWIHYILVNAFGGIVNYGVYSILITYSALVREFLVIGVAAGALSGLVLNFTMSKFWVFRNSAEVVVGDEK